MSRREPEVLWDEVRSAIDKIERPCAGMDKHAFLEEDRYANTCPWDQASFWTPAMPAGI